MAALAEKRDAKSGRTLRGCTVARSIVAFAVENESRKRSGGQNSSRKSHTTAKRKAMRCSKDGCVRQQRSNGLCKAHGGGRRCCVEACLRSDQGGGFCIRHGGGERCSVDGCKNSAQRRGLCKAHGGGSFESIIKRIHHEMMAVGGGSKSHVKPQVKTTKDEAATTRAKKKLTSSDTEHARVEDIKLQSTLPAPQPVEKPSEADRTGSCVSVAALLLSLHGQACLE